VNGFSFLPIRCCLKITGNPSSRQTQNAAMQIKGEASNNPIKQMKFLKATMIILLQLKYVNMENMK
jgi:hypothetical protein